MRALSSTPALRLGSIVLASFVVVASSGEASAAKIGASRELKKRVKRVKRELVDVERRLDEFRARIDELRGESRASAEEIRSARAELAETPVHRGLLPDFQALSAFVRLTAARAERDQALDRQLRTRQQIFFVMAERDENIDRLESLVQESRRESPKKLPNWSLDGSLITYSADWEAVSQCESSGRWHINTGLFDGGLQFHPVTWIGFGGGELARYAYEATKKQQIAIAERVLAVQGPRAWPNCFQPLPFHF